MKPARRAVVVVCDSLAHDLVRPESAPALCALRETSANFVSARGVFPSTTRTSAASMATGCLPSEHGVLGNTMVLTEDGKLVCLSVGKPDFLDRLRRATGRTLRRPTWAQRLADHGGCVVMSNVSPGAAYMHDPDSYGYVYHRSHSTGPGGLRLADGLSIEVGAAGDMAMTERFCREVLRERAPALSVLWLSEPDHTAHRTAPGSPEHLAMIRVADACVDEVRRTVDMLDPNGQNTLLVACSDHGMETVGWQVQLDALLVEAGWKESLTSSDVVIAPNGNSALLYFSDEARQRIPAIAQWLRNQDFAWGVFLGESLAEVGLPTDGALGIALALYRDDVANAYGVPGRSVSVRSPFSDSSPPGCGQHGGLGANEQHPFLFIRGRGFRRGRRMQSASLIDIAPTVLRHLGADARGMQGRPLQDDARTAAAAKPLRTAENAPRISL